MGKLIKVKEDTHQALTKLKGELQKTARYDVTFDDVINKLLKKKGC